MLGLVAFILLSFFCGCNEVNSFISRPLSSEGIYAAITPAATVLLVVKRNWRRFGCSGFEERLSFSMVDDLAGVRMPSKRLWMSTRSSFLTPSNCRQEALTLKSHQPLRISLIGVRLSFRDQLDEICPHSVSDLPALQRRQEFLSEVLLQMEILCCLRPVNLIENK